MKGSLHYMSRERVVPLPWELSTLSRSAVFFQRAFTSKPGVVSQNASIGDTGMLLLTWSVTTSSLALPFLKNLYTQIVQCRRVYCNAKQLYGVLNSYVFNSFVFRPQSTSVVFFLLGILLVYI